MHTVKFILPEWIISSVIMRQWHFAWQTRTRSGPFQSNQPWNIPFTPGWEKCSEKSHQHAIKWNWIGLMIHHHCYDFTLQHPIHIFFYSHTIFFAPLTIQRSACNVGNSNSNRKFRSIVEPAACNTIQMNCLLYSKDSDSELCTRMIS